MGAQNGWLVKKEQEGLSGRVEYFSREAAEAAGNLVLAPRLILEGMTANQPPVAEPDSALAVQGEPITVSVKANDSDPNNDPIRVTAVSEPAHGIAVLNPDETITYRSDADCSGTDTFTYTLEDNAGLTASGTVTVQVGRPYLTTLEVLQDSYLRQWAPNTNEGGSSKLRVKALGNNRALVKFDIGGADLAGLISARLVLTVSYAADNWGDGRLVFAHKLLSDWSEGNGWVDGRTYRGTGAGTTWRCPSDTNISNHAADCGEVWNGGLYAAPTGEGVVHTNGMVGEVVFDVTKDLKAGAAFGWILKKELEGRPGRVEYHSRESAAALGDPYLAPKLILERIPLENQGPVAVDDEASTVIGAPVTIEVLTNDTGEGLSVTGVIDPPNGVADVAGGISITYTPDPAFMGTDSFVYTVTDTNSQTDTATVTVTVSAPPLVVVGDVATMLANTVVTIQVLANDSGYGLSLRDVTAPLNGMAVIDGSQVTYTPGTDFVGTETFQYSVTDSSLETATATVTVTVNAPPPVAGDDAASTIAGAPVTVAVLANDTGLGLTVTGVTDPSSGTGEIAGGSSVTYTPDAGFMGTDSFTYTITDVASVTATANVTVTVGAPPNAAPVAVDDTATTWEGLEVIIDVLSNDTDGDNDSLSVPEVTQPSNGSATVNQDNTVTYTPAQGFAGTDTLIYTVSDGRGGTDMGTVTVTVNDDAVPPKITPSLDPLPNAAGWNNSDVTVRFDCSDAEGGIETCTDPITLSSEGANQEVSGIATDRAGNSETATVVVSLDKTAPSVSITGPSSGRRGQALTVSGTASDNLALGTAAVSVSGVDVASFTDSPFEYTFGFPQDAATGSLVPVGALATDAAGNQAQATPVQIEVLGGGFVFGEVYDASGGVPLSGATISHSMGEVQSDPSGRFSFLTEEATVVVHVEADGFTRAARVASVDSLQGTVLLDARLTPLHEEVTTIGAGGGTVTNETGSVELTVPSGALGASTDMRVTSVPRHGLVAPLPLGWSPVGAMELGPTGTAFAVDADLRLSVGGISGFNLVLARYDESLHAWITVADGITGETFVTSAISSTGAYAFVIADEAPTAPPVPVVGEGLVGAEPVDVRFGVYASSEVTPEAAPVSPDVSATGSVALTSVVPLPSGTVISAKVAESFESFVEGTLYTEPFTQEMPIYRYPTRDDGELHMEFPVTPSREVTLTDIAEGMIHVAIETAPLFLQGSLVGAEGVVLTGDGDAELVVPAGGLSQTVAASANALDPLTLGVGFEGYGLLAAAEIDLGGATLSLSGTLSLPVAELASTDNLFAAKFLYVQGQRKLRLVGTAAYVDGRIFSNEVDSGGIYLFFQSMESLAFVQGIVRESGTPASLAVVESSTTPFADVTTSNGAYLVGAVLDETAVTARSLVSGNSGIVTITPAATDPVTADIELSTTGPYVTSVTPQDGTLGVAVAPSIRVDFSEPVEPATVATSSFSLATGGAPVPGRIVLSNANRTASFLPDETLETVTTYEIALTADITDVNGNGLLPFSSSFTTLDETVAGFNTDAVTVSFPDQDGLVTVEAPRGSFESGASVTLINQTKAVVVSGSVSGDGSFSFTIVAAVTDVLQIRIVDSSDREVVIDKTEYRAADGRVAIGVKGGKIAEGEVTLEVPDGALTQVAIFRLTPVPQAAIDALPLAFGAGGFGSAVEVDMGDASLAKEADLSFPVPTAAPVDADFAIVRKLVENDVTLYEIIDQANVEDGRVTTASFPFLGVLNPGFYLTVWYPPMPPTGKNPMGVITGLARETDFSPVNPTYLPMKGVRVGADKSLGYDNGDHVTTTREDGRFVLLDFAFGTPGAVVDLVASDSRGRQVRAQAFEKASVASEYPNLSRYRRTGDVVFNFELGSPPPPPSTITIQLLDADGDAIANGYATVNEELLIQVTFTEPPNSASLKINSSPVVLENIDDMNWKALYTPLEARGYTVLVETIDAFLNPVSVTKSFLAVVGAAGNEESLVGPPSLITDALVPNPGSIGVSVEQVLSVQFTEPVNGVASSTVVLREKDGPSVTLEIIGTGAAGTGPVNPSDEVYALTLTPSQGLKFATVYELELSGGIVDVDEGNSLVPDPTTIDFATFSPGELGKAEANNAIALAVLGDRAFVVLNTYPAVVRAFDISDPLNPASDGDTPVVGIFPHISAEASVDIGSGPSDLVATLTTNSFSGQGTLIVLDVGEETPPFPWVAAVTTNQGTEGYAAALDLYEGFAYVATGPSGLKVVDLTLAADLYRSATPLEVSQALNTTGQGFGQAGIVHTVPIEYDGATLTATAVTAKDTAAGRVAFVGARSLQAGSSTGHITSVSHSGGYVLQTLPLPMGWIYGIGLTSVGARELAVIVGSAIGGGGTLAVVDVTNPSVMTLLSFSELEGGEGASVSFDAEGTTAFVGSTGGVESFSLADPEAPQSIGFFGNVDPQTSINGEVLVSAGPNEGLKLTALDVVPVLSVYPPVLITDDLLQVVHPGEFRLRVVPASFDVISAEVDIFSGDTVVATVPGVLLDGQGSALFDTGLVLPATEPVAQLVLNRGFPSYEKRSVRVPVDFEPLIYGVSPEIHVKLDVDLVNQTVCLRAQDPIRYRLGSSASVTISLIVDGVETPVFSDEMTPTQGDPNEYFIDDINLFPPQSATYHFRIVAALPQDPTVRVERVGEIKVAADTFATLPVGHTFAKGVDLLDGHLVVSATDVRIPGRLPLEITRTYGSLGSSEEGAMGAGWSFNYMSTLIITGCGYTIRGGDGTGQRFIKNGNEFIPQKGYHTTLVENPDGSYDFYTKGRVRYHYMDDLVLENNPLYGGALSLDYIEDTNGNRINVGYDNERKITEVREVFADETEGRSLGFQYNTVLGEPRVVRITGPMGLEIIYTYDALANLVSVTRAERIQGYEYSVTSTLDRHNLTAYTDPNQNRTEYEYYTEADEFPGETPDPLSVGKYEWIKEVREAAGEPEQATTSFIYDLTEITTTGRFITHVTDPRSNTTIYRLNQNGSPLEIEEPGGILTTMEWSSHDIYKTKENDAENRITRFEYDDRANLTKEIIETTEFGEVITEFDYDPVFNKITYKKDAEGRETVFEIDPANGNLLSITDAEQNVTRFDYDPDNGDLEHQWDARGHRTRFDYDENGNPTYIEDALGNHTYHIYDERSRKISTEDSFGRTSEWIYDALDRIHIQRRFDDKGSSATEEITTTYFPNGEVQTQTNGLALVTMNVLDGLNRVREQRQSGGDLDAELITLTDYDGNGNVEQLTDRRNVVTDNDYDELNRLIRVTVTGSYGDPQVVSEVGYDDVGNKRYEIDVRGNRTDFVYDELYRVRERKLPTDPASHVETFTYDLVGNKMTQSDANGKVTVFEYDGLNRMTLKTDPEQNQIRFGYDELGNLTEEEDLTRGLSTAATFDPLNRLLSRTVTASAPNAFGYVTTFEYDDSAHTVVETDPRRFEKTTILDGFDRVHEVQQETGDGVLVTKTYYDGNGNVERITDAENRTTEFVYDGLNRLTETQFPLGLTSDVEYDGEGNKTTETNRRGLDTHFEYDNLGRLVETRIEQPITQTGGQSELALASIVYDDANRKRTETDARGHTTTYELDEQDRVVKITDPADEYLELAYDGVNKRSETDKRRNTTHFEYDGLNRLVKVIDPLLQELHTDYRDAERQVVETDRRNIETTNQLDALGRLVSVTRSGVVLERHDYDGNNNRVLSEDANGNKTQFAYDGANRLARRTAGFETPLATTTTFKYDRVGNLLEEKDGRITGQPFDVKNTYDDLNRLRFVQDAGGNITEFEYDEDGNRTAQIEPSSERTEYDFGELNELIEVRMADGGIYQYEYDENRNRIGQTDGEDHVVTFTFDALNRLDLMIQDPAGFNYITDHDYDPNANQIKLTDPKGQVTDYSYDELNRLTSKVFSLAAGDFELYTRTHQVDYNYDENNNLTRVDEHRSTGSDPVEVVSNVKTYNDLDRIETERDTTNRQLTHDYDYQGNRTLLVDPDGNRTVYEYDALNRLETIKLEEDTANEQAVRYTYHPDGLKHSVYNPNGTTSTYGYDAADRVTSISHSGPTGTVSAYGYMYDPNGNRLQQVETNAGRTETTTYDYDDVNRLTEVTYEFGTPTARTTTYTYDKTGNRLTEQQLEVQTSNILKDLVYDYDEINRLETITDNLDAAENVAYQYDANGNTTSKFKAGVETTYHYDIRNQLGEVREDTNVLGRYGYDYDGRRILKIGDDGRRHYTYDQRSAITEVDDAGQTVSKYDYGLDQLVSLSNRNDGTSYFHLDFLGSTVNLTDEAGSTRQSILFDAWGNERERIGSSTNRFTFTGHEKDEETGLIYAKARFYDPGVGRFLSQDIVLGSPEMTPSLNRYSYVGNRPTVMVDRFGFYGEDVHRGLTFYLAGRGAGFTREEARDLASWSQSIDEDPATKPVRKGTEAELRKQMEDNELLGLDVSALRYWPLCEIERSRRPVSDLEKELSEWHLPKGKGERFVKADSPAARSRIEQATKLAEAAKIAGIESGAAIHDDVLRYFGRGLHPFQDSFSHEGGQYAHPYRGRPGDLDYSTPLLPNTDWTFTTPEKSERMARRVLEVMLKFRRARGDRNVPSFEKAWSIVEDDVREFNLADTRQEKEAIMTRWGVEPGSEGEWHIAAPEKKEPSNDQQGIWGTIRSWTKSQYERTIGEPWKRHVVEPARKRLEREILRRQKEEERRAQKRRMKRQYVVVPELPEGK